jgi:hypothetical protein
VDPEELDSLTRVLQVLLEHHTVDLVALVVMLQLYHIRQTEHFTHQVTQVVLVDQVQLVMRDQPVQALAQVTQAQVVIQVL